MNCSAPINEEVETKEEKEDEKEDENESVEDHEHKSKKVDKRNSKPINWDQNNSAVGKVESVQVNSQGNTKESKPDPQSSDIEQKPVGQLDESEDEEYYSDEFKDGKTSQKSSGKNVNFEEVGTRPRLSEKKEETYSDEYSEVADQEEAKDNVESPETNAQDYFKILDNQKPQDLTTEGANRQAEGGSVFNQTGGRFMARDTKEPESKRYH